MSAITHRHFSSAEENRLIQDDITCAKQVLTVLIGVVVFGTVSAAISIAVICLPWM